ncbi:MAG: hypothetical protein IJ217_04625 [Clostridia bacterium]|nr:hypothetical protein [Clostridia bacterium]
MKKMLEELRELNNEEEYEVPAGFRDKVISSITEERKSSKIKYIIPACFVAAVALVTVVVAGNPNVRTKYHNTDMKENQLYATNDANGLEEYALESDLERMLTADMSSATNTAMAGDSYKYNEFEAMKAVSPTEYYNEILDMLKINNVEAEKIDDGVRAKGKKEEIEMILYYFEGEVEITQEGGYVVIKEK